MKFSLQDIQQETKPYNRLKPALRDKNIEKLKRLISGKKSRGEQTPHGGLRPALRDKYREVKQLKK